MSGSWTWRSHVRSEMDMVPRPLGTHIAMYYHYLRSLYLRSLCAFIYKNSEKIELTTKFLQSPKLNIYKILYA